MTASPLFPFHMTDPDIPGPVRDLARQWVDLEDRSPLARTLELEERIDQQLAASARLRAEADLELATSIAELAPAKLDRLDLGEERAGPDGARIFPHVTIVPAGALAYALAFALFAEFHPAHHPTAPRSRPAMLAAIGHAADVITGATR